MTGNAACDGGGREQSPMIVEWPGTSRSDFERRLRAGGLLVAAYDGCKLRVLDRCAAKGRYAYGGLTKSEDVWEIASAADLHAKLPVGASVLAGRVGGKKRLALSYALVGWYGAVQRPRLGRPDLEGDDCSAATHFVQSVQLGAFRLASTGEISGELGVGLVGGAAEASESVVSKGGEISACLGGRNLPEPSCSTPVQIRLAELDETAVPARACAASEELYVDACVPAAKGAVTCPAGARWDGARCQVEACPTGTQLVDGACVRTERVAGAECPAGSEWSGGACTRHVVVREVECPAGTTWNATRCVPRIDLACPPGLSFVRGRGCVPGAAESGALAARPAEAPRPTSVAPTSCGPGSVRITGGAFVMGSASGEGNANELPAHRVEVVTYCLDATEVTVAAYERCAASGACPPAATSVEWPGIHDEERSASSLCNGGKRDRSKHPINCVDWTSADAYCRFVRGRLPTEQEWEYAARGTAERTFPWGEQAPTTHHLNGCGSECLPLLASIGATAGRPLFEASDGYPSTAPVGSFPAGATPEGVLDLAGNLWEWTASYYGPYPAPADTGTDRVYRGGGFTYTDATNYRAARRGHFDPTMRSHNLGFRCAY